MTKKITWVGIVLFLAFSIHCSAENAKKVAVQPFKNISHITKYDWIGDGCAESISGHLNSIEGMKMVERSQINSVMNEVRVQMSGLTEETQAVRTGKMLGADTVIIGSYQINRNEVKVIARIVDIESGLVAMSVEEQGSLDDIFAIENNVAADILEKMGYYDQAKKIKKAGTKTARNKYTEDKELIFGTFRAITLKPLYTFNSSLSLSAGSQPLGTLAGADYTQNEDFSLGLRTATGFALELEFPTDRQMPFLLRLSSATYYVSDLSGTEKAMSYGVQKGKIDTNLKDTDGKLKIDTLFLGWKMFFDIPQEDMNTSYITLGINFDNITKTGDDLDAFNIKGGLGFAASYGTLINNQFDLELGLNMCFLRSYVHRAEWYDANPPFAQVFNENISGSYMLIQPFIGLGYRF